MEPAVTKPVPPRQDCPDVEDCASDPSEIGHVCTYGPICGTCTVYRVIETALVVHEALETLKMPSVVKTTGSKGLHVYVPIVRAPTQKAVWTFAKAFAQTVASNYPELATAEYRVEKRPKGRVLVDYNQNRWGATLASVYSVRATPMASVSLDMTVPRPVQ